MNFCVITLAGPRVVLEPVDAPALAVLRVREAGALARRHHALRLGAPLHALHVTLAGAQSRGLAPRELAARHAPPDACVLGALAPVPPRRGGLGRTRARGPGARRCR